MLYWSCVYFICALIAAVLGFGNIGELEEWAALFKALFFIFFGAFIVSLLAGVFRRSV